MFFNPLVESIVDIAVAFAMVQLFDANFGHAMVSITNCNTYIADDIPMDIDLVRRWQSL